MYPKAKNLSLSAATLALATLAACGGGGGASDPDPMTPPPVADSVPDTAYASAQAWVGFAASLSPDDVSEPLLLGTKAPPTADTTEPQPL
jgi:hypothetical protein